MSDSTDRAIRELENENSLLRLELAIRRANTDRARRVIRLRAENDELRKQMATEATS